MRNSVRLQRVQFVDFIRYVLNIFSDYNIVSLQISLLQQFLLLYLHISFAYSVRLVDASCLGILKHLVVYPWVPYFGKGFGV